MKTYYDQRAPEYDDVWLGTGRFAERNRPEWAEERERLIRLLRELPSARTLDVACGTGFLTRFLPGEIVALDQSESMLRLARGRVPSASFVRADVPPLPFEDGAFDRLFTSFFYGHLQAGEREAFVAEARRVARELIVVDAAPGVGGERDEWQERTLDDGSRWRVYKRYFSPETLTRELGGGKTLHAGRRFVAVRA